MLVDSQFLLLLIPFVRDCDELYHLPSVESRGVLKGDGVEGLRKLKEELGQEETISNTRDKWIQYRSTTWEEMKSEMDPTIFNSLFGTE